MPLSDEQTTPNWLYHGLDNIFEFELDAAATEKNTKCVQFYDKKTNGLLSPWAFSCFCNPPYSRGQLKQWTNKAFQEVGRGNNSVLVLPADTSTLWHTYTRKTASRLFYLTGRVKFGQNKHPAKFGTLIAIYGYTPIEYSQVQRHLKGWMPHPGEEEYDPKMFTGILQ